MNWSPPGTTAKAGDAVQGGDGEGGKYRIRIYASLGTGSFVLMHSGAQPVTASYGLLSTIAWGLNGRVTYALEGSIFSIRRFLRACSEVTL